MTNWYSASQLATFTDCQRKWFFEKILKFKGPETPAMKLGTEIHNQIETYFKSNGETDPTNPLAATLLSTVPEPQPGIVAEGKLTFEVRPGVNFVGFLDLLDDRDPTHPVIIDHKTSSNVAMWGKTEYELPTDLQLMSYAAHRCALSEDVQHVTVAHNQIDTKKRGPSRLVKATVNREHVQARRLEHLKIIDEMEELRASTDDVRKAPKTGEENGACEKFGGCPHLSRCRAASMGQEIRPMQDVLPKDAPTEGEPTVTVSNKLAALRSKLNNETDTPPDAPKPEAPKPEPATQVAKPAKKKRAPRKKKAPAKKAPETAETIATVPAGPTTITLPSPVSRILFVGCMPSDSTPVLFERWIAPLLEDIRTTSGVEWGAVDFGKGKGILAAKVRDATDVPDRLFVDPASPSAHVALEILVPRFDVVVRAVQ